MWLETRLARRRVLAAVAIMSLLVGSSILYLGLLTPPAESHVPTTPIEHVVVIMKENHAFDNYFGTFPGVEGLGAGRSLPDGRGGFVETHFLDGTSTPDLPHDRESMIRDYNGGRNDGFVISAEAWGAGLGNYSMGYFDNHQLPGYWELASEYVIADHYFHSMLGPTIPNRLYSIAGTAGGITSNLLPPEGLTFPTIFDQLETAKISWAYYNESTPGYLPLPMHFTALRSRASMVSKLLPLGQLATDMRNGLLPAVTYVDPQSGLGVSEHPPENVTRGDAWTMSIVSELVRGPQWSSTALFLTWDEAGGYYDHVPPPQVDEWGYGFRVPMLVISAYAKRGSVDKEVMDHTSILRFISRNWNLVPLTYREAQANDMSSAFNFVDAGTGNGYVMPPPTPPIAQTLRERRPKLPASSSAPTDDGTWVIDRGV